VTDHPHAAIYRKMSQEMSEGGLEAMAAGLAEDVEWWEIGATSPIVGRQALVDRMMALASYEISGDLHDVVANDDHMIALIAVTARKGDETLNYKVAEIYHVNAHGQVAQRWAFSDDTQSIINFFS